MSIEGLTAVLEKEEIVATQRAEDLMAHPDLVDETYRRHVRTYVPFSRQAAGGDGQSVPDFEKKVIRDIKDAKAVRGYITAEYGHGKTSTALYLWERAREANILAVPPFQLNRLTDLIQATYGWARYEIGRTRPNSAALAEATQLYESLINRSAATYAKRYDITEAAARQMINDKPDMLDLTPADYINFFEEITRLAQGAGYEGLLILADELQQYIDPQIKAGIKDPVTPFFDVVSAILTRRGHLAMGLIVVIPPRELDVLRDQRGDLIHRLLQVSLDLRAVYNQDFPQRLWHNLAKAHDFDDHRDRIMAPEALASLGQVGGRDDLSDGPRTIVNTFRRATRLYQERNYPYDHPYTPESLVDDLLTGNIQYDSSKRIAQVASVALGNTLVRGIPAREKAIKWAAAFPNEGIPRAMQERYGLTDAFDELAQSALGDLIISVGDVHNKGFTLRGLEPGKVQTDWLSTTMREFWRNYVETADKTRERAMAGFVALLKRSVFPDNQWKVQREMQSRYTQNAGLILQGAFATSRQRYPDRTVHIRLLWEDEAVKDANMEGDVLVEIRLRRYLDMPEDERTRHEEPLQIDADTRTIRLTLNLMGRTTELSPSLEQAVSSLVSPFKLSPLLLLNLNQVIEEARERGAIPKNDDEAIRYGFQPDLIDNSFRQLFNDIVGQPVGAAQERIVETALLEMLEALYPDYHPIILIQSWSSSLQRYQKALESLESNYERQGQTDVEGTKDEIANLFPLSNTGLDSFARNFPALIDGVGKLPGQGKGSVRFTLHPLEQVIKKWIAESATTQSVRVANTVEKVHTLPKQTVYDHGRRLGYLDGEIDALINLMSLRGLTEEDTRLGLLREAVSLAPSADELEADIDDCLHDIRALQSLYATDPQLQRWAESLAKSKEHLNEVLRKKPDDTQLYNRKRGVHQLRTELDSFVQSKQSGLQETAGRLARQVTPADPNIQQRLEKSIQGVVEYVSQVNDQLRTRLLQQYIKLNHDAASLQQSVETMRAALGQEDLSIAAQIELAKELKSYDAALEQLRDRRTTFAKHYADYSSWIKLVEDGNYLSEHLNQMGELVLEERQAFEQLSRDIRGHLSSRKLEGLPDAPTYSIRLSDLTGAVREKRSQATDKFTRLQERYREAIWNHLHFPKERLWNPHHLNPLALDDSYSRLYTDVRETMRTVVLRKFHDLIVEFQGSIRDTLQSPLIKDLPPEEQTQIRGQAHGLQAQLLELDDKLAMSRDTTNDINVIVDFPEGGGGQFEALLLGLAEVARGIGALKPEVDGLSQKLQKMELSPSEASLLEIMQSNNGSVDLGIIRQASSKVNEDEFWHALSGLQAKRRVRITIERITYD